VHTRGRWGFLRRHCDELGPPVISSSMRAPAVPAHRGGDREGGRGIVERERGSRRNETVVNGLPCGLWAVGTRYFGRSRYCVVTKAAVTGLKNTAGCNTVIT